MTWAGTLGPTYLVVDTARQETLMSAQDHLLAAHPWDQATCFCDGDWDVFLGGNLLFPQPALDSLELVGRHPVPGREVACRHTLVVSLKSPGEGDD